VPQAGRNGAWQPAVGALGEIQACTEPLASLGAPGERLARAPGRATREAR